LTPFGSSEGADDGAAEGARTARALGVQAGAAGIGEMDQECASVLGVWFCTHQARGKERFDGLGRRLVRHPAAVGQLCRGLGPTAVQEAENRLLTGRHGICRPGGANESSESLPQVLGQHVVGHRRLHAELAKDPRTTFRRVMYGLSGDTPHSDPPVEPLVPPGRGFLDLFEDPEELPAWLTEVDIDTLATEFAEAGFTSALNWYRNFDRNWQLTAPWDGAQYRVPGCYLTGDRDLVYGFPGMDQLIPALPTLHPTIGPAHILPGCGHWIAEEQPDEVNAALLEFLGTLNR
jgi:pimeloyl-ACP methyl ester carboxylesterase